jgi:hypothetical protein
MRSGKPDRVSGGELGLSNANVTRYFKARPGTSTVQAAKDLVVALQAQGYTDASGDESGELYTADGTCTSTKYCTFFIDVIGDVIEVRIET